MEFTPLLAPGKSSVKRQFNLLMHNCSARSRTAGNGGEERVKAGKKEHNRAEKWASLVESRSKMGASLT
jgi:hypothetical protein